MRWRRRQEPVEDPDLVGHAADGLGRLGDPTAIGTPAWSPDGRHLAVTAREPTRES